MSFILEALKKSDRERKRGEVPTLESVDFDTGDDLTFGRNLMPWYIGGGITAVLGVVAVLLMGGDEPAPGREMTAMEKAPGEMALETTTAPSPEPPQPATVQPEPEPAPEPKAEATPAPESEPVPAPEPEPAPTPEPAPAPEPKAETTPVPAPKTRIMPKVTDDGAPVPDAQPVARVDAAPVSAPVSMPTSASKLTATQTQPTPPKAAPQIAPRVIQLAALDSTEAYVERGWVSLDKGLYNQAAQDFSSAIELEPNYAEAWFARGWVKEKMGDDEGALKDYSRTLRAQANHTGALFSRAYLNLYTGENRKAVRDFNATLNIADPSLKLYTYLWLYVARAEGGEDATGALARQSARENLDAWPGVVVRYFLGTMAESNVIAAIENGNADALQARRCVGYFFLGKRALMNGNTQMARNYFEKTLATGVIGFRQFDAARRELSRLAQ